MQILLFCNSICRIFLRRKSLSFNSVYDWLGFSNQLPEDQSKFHLKPIKGVSKCTRIIFGEERGNFFKHVNEEITVTPLIRTLRGAQKVSVLMGCPYYKRPGGRKTGFDCKKVSGKMILHFFRSSTLFCYMAQSPNRWDEANPEFWLGTRLGNMGHSPFPHRP